MINDHHLLALHNCIECDLRPSAAELQQATSEAAERAAHASKQLAVLDREQGRLRLALHLFAQLTDLQAILGRLESTEGGGGGGEGEEEWLGLVARATAFPATPVLSAYTIRYGGDPAAFIAEEQGKARTVLQGRLHAFFQETSVSQSDNLGGLRETLLWFGRIGRAGEGIAQYGRLLREQFRIALAGRLGDLMAGKVQLPFAGRLALVFDAVTGVIRWNEGAVFNDPLLTPHAPLVIDGLREEADEHARLIAADFGREILANEQLSADLRLMDMALVEAVSLVRQSVAFYGSHDSVMACPPGFLRSLITEYRRLEGEYIRQAVLRAVSEGIMTASVAEDVVFVGKKGIRRAMSTLESSCIEAALSTFKTILLSNCIALLKKGSGQSSLDLCNALSALASLLLDLVDLVEADMSQLSGDIWSASPGSEPAKPSFLGMLSDFRRTSDMLEGQVRALLSSTYLNTGPIGERLKAIKRAVSGGNVEYCEDRAEGIFASLSKAIAELSSLTLDNQRRLFHLLAISLSQVYEAAVSTMQQQEQLCAVEREVRHLHALFAEATDAASGEAFQGVIEGISNKL